jgi:GNAT superfamily N-acetyltransferase
MGAQPLVQPSFSIRKSTPHDATICGQICYEAFRTINENHNFPPDIPTVEIAIGILSFMFSNPQFYCVVAEANGKLIGSNCLDERGAIAGVGPITIDPKQQNMGVGRELMQAVMDRAHERSSMGVRLVQAAFHNRSMSLYTKLGFLIREPLAVMQGRINGHCFDSHKVRPAATDDVEECNRLCVRVHGHDRAQELVDGIKMGIARVAERDGRIVAFTSGLAFFGHSVAETNEDLAALIASAEQMGGAGILLPTRNTELFRWCLENGLQMVEPMTLMTLGLYNEPRGAYLTSISF